jgi:hypothetical protein
MMTGEGLLGRLLKKAVAASMLGLSNAEINRMHFFRGDRVLDQAYLDTKRLRLQNQSNSCFRGCLEIRRETKRIRPICVA